MVEKGMSVLTSLIATNLTLQLTRTGPHSCVSCHLLAHPPAALNKTVIRDIVGYSSDCLAALGDISSDDLRQVLVKLQLPAPDAPHATDSKADLFYYRLSFVLAGESEPSYVQGTVSCTFTDDTAMLAQQDNDVRVALAIASASALDRVIYELLAGHKLQEARAKKQEAIKMLKDVEAIDNSGFVKHLVVLGEAALASMAQSNVDVAQVRKAVHWTGGAGIVHRKCF